ncbi:MAG: molybdenum cofactor biosynthesis protein MoaE [Acidobacteriota bacterium]
MNLQEMLSRLKNHPDYHDSGMILIHNGVVRNHSRDGRKVESLSIKVDHGKIERIIEKNKKKKGIIEILIDIKEGTDLKVGEDLMYLLVMGDIRDNIIPVLKETLDEIKETAALKQEVFL